ncbi:8383_t:CDS:2, partial [Acaulospora morrowiae]
GFIIVGLAGIIGYCFIKVLIRVRPIIDVGTTVVGGQGWRVGT